MSIYSIDALKAFYKDQFTRDIDSPTVKELLSRPMSPEQAEEIMMKQYQDQEKQVTDNYNEMFYHKP